MGFETLREEEIAFFKSNSVAFPSGVRSIAVTGGKTQPTLETDHLNHSGVGKAQVSDEISAYNPNSYNAAS